MQIKFKETVGNSELNIYFKCSVIDLNCNEYLLEVVGGGMCISSYNSNIKGVILANNWFRIKIQ